MEGGEGAKEEERIHKVTGVYCSFCLLGIDRSGSAPHDATHRAMGLKGKGEGRNGAEGARSVEGSARMIDCVTRL